MFAASKSGKVAAAAAATDPYFPYVPLLLETTSTNGQQNNTFLDSSTNNFTITRNGTPTQGSVTPYWPDGQWSNYFNGSSDWLSTPDSADFALGSGDFTADCWIYPTSFANEAIIMGQWSGDVGGTTLNFALLLSAGSTGYLRLITSANGSSVLFDLSTSTTSFTLSLNTWQHVAAVRSGTTFTVYVNGISRASTTNASALFNATNAFTIGAESNTQAQYFTGYISNARLVKGTALVPPSGGPTSPASTSTTNQVLLTCYSNRFFDSNTATTAKTITVGGGTPKVQAFQPFSPPASYTAAAYGGSGYFSGASANSYLSASGNASTAMGTGDFTWECWVYLVASTNYQDFIDTRSNVALGSTDGFFWGLNSNTLTPIIYTTSVLLTSSINVALNGWTHVAVTRSGTTLTIWVNGVSGGTTTNSTNLSNQSFSVGSANTTNVQTNGYISNLRIVKGTAVYTGAFAPPTLAPLTTAGSTSAASYSSTTNVNTSFAASATSLLTNFTNAGIYDAAVQNNVITVGDAQASTTITAKWPPTSMKFDGTGDYLQSPFQPQFQLGSGNFTIEFWVYFNSVASGQRIAGQDNSASNVTWAIYTTVSGRLDYYLSSTGSAWNIATSASMGNIAINTWYYVALVRNGATFTPYINSVAGTVTTNSAALFASTAPLTIGADASGPTSYFNGYIQDFRLTKGVARTITTPTAAFPTR